MTDKEILAKLGLTEKDASDLIQKVNSLNASQLKALLGSSTDPDEAADSLGEDCSPSDLQRFLAARQGIAHGTAQIYYGNTIPQDEFDEED
ncbi:MAG: hypothetical protein M3Z32_03725 [Acidobacteriota bacterium]|nr:hypothetical protein [Acidobacteriota bacterium]